MKHDWNVGKSSTSECLKQKFVHFWVKIVCSKTPFEKSMICLHFCALSLSLNHLYLCQSHHNCRASKYPLCNCNDDWLTHGYSFIVVYCVDQFILLSTTNFDSYIINSIINCNECFSLILTDHDCFIYSCNSNEYNELCHSLLIIELQTCFFLHQI